MRIAMLKIVALPPHPDFEDDDWELLTCQVIDRAQHDHGWIRDMLLDEVNCIGLGEILFGEIGRRWQDRPLPWQPVTAMISLGGYSTHDYWHGTDDWESEIDVIEVKSIARSSHLVPSDCRRIQRRRHSGRRLVEHAR